MPPLSPPPHGLLPRSHLQSPRCVAGLARMGSSAGCVRAVGVDQHPAAQVLHSHPAFCAHHSTPLPTHSQPNAPAWLTDVFEGASGPTMSSGSVSTAGEPRKPVPHARR